VGSSRSAREALPPAVLLMGPTAAGKTALALALADEFPVELISVDSAQVYRGLDIGAAKPDARTLARWPHALIDIREPEDNYSVAEFVADCEACMVRARAASRLPVLVGGTMMYFNALIYGLDNMPPADERLRRQIAAEADEYGWAHLHAELAAVDRLAAEAIRPTDPQRIQRAIEVLRLTGQGPSQLRTHNKIPRFDTLRLVVSATNRHVLHERIRDRLETMLEKGFIDEVSTLRRRPGLSIDHASMRSVGYRQVWQLLDGLFDEADLNSRVLAATRQLAKRQLTALRRMHGALWYDPDRNLTIKRVFRRVAGFSGQCGRRD
jgi:tRNA dimethylallyltransferase